MKCMCAWAALLNLWLTSFYAITSFNGTHWYKRCRKRKKYTNVSKENKITLATVTRQQQLILATITISKFTNFCCSLATLLLPSYAAYLLPGFGPCSQLYLAIWVVWIACMHIFKSKLFAAYLCHAGDEATDNRNAYERKKDPTEKNM